MTEAVDYSFVVPAYNEEACLPETLDCLLGLVGAVESHRGEVVVVDNNSTDRTAELATARGARVVFESHRQIARSRNAGGKAARGRYLFFVDADTTIPESLLRESLTALDSGAVVGGGALVRFDRMPDEPAARRLLKVWLWLSKTMKWACGAYVFCLREAFLEVDGFDERFYASEEIHFSRRLKRWGRRHEKRMVILDGPIVSSARKLEWFTVGYMRRLVISLVLCPWRLRSREACAFWYERPAGGGAAGDASRPAARPGGSDGR